MINRVKELVLILNKATEEYDAGHPTMSDTEWDNLYFELQKLEKETGFVFNNSPTHSIHFKDVSELEKVKHTSPMLSLQKTKEINEIWDYFGGHPSIAMLKMDGLTCRLTYKNGLLVAAETRGNGEIGENIFCNAMQVLSIPQRINYKEDLEVDGEIICTYKDFEDYGFIHDYKNPRNFAAGSIRLLSSEECRKRNLTFVAWDCNKNNTLLSEKLNFLNDLSFIVCDYICWSEQQEIANSIKKLKLKAEENSYPIDGIVFKFNEVSFYNSLGRTDHHYKGGMAFKFKDEIVETTLLDIEWTEGRTGVLTPVAVYEDVELEGTICNKASLHNISVMKNLWEREWHTGLTLEVFKSNQIIPQVKNVSLKNPCCARRLSIPKTCPVCGESTEIKDNDGVKTLWCTNPSCSGKIINRLDWFFGKRGLDAKGLSKATFEKLLDWGYIKSISDVFELDKFKTEWKNKDGFGTKSVESILKSIEGSKNTILESVISAAGIPLVGRAVAKVLAKEFMSYDAFRAAVRDDKYDFSCLEGFGKEMNKSLKTFDYTELDFIVKNYLTIEEVSLVDNSDDSLSGKVFVVTGKLKTFKNRSEIKSLIESKGGKVTDSVTSKTNYLINNDKESTTAKNKKAKELNIPIISEEEFIKDFIV